MEIKMDKINSFADFVEKNPSWEEKYNVQQFDSPRFKRIISTWNENQQTHTYAHTVDTETGDIFLDCRRRKIFAKQLTFCFLRPLYTVAATAFHLLGGGIIKAVIEGKNKGEKDEEILKRCVYSIQDIVRTPLYGLAMTATHIAGVILALISPNSLYHTRKLAGRLEMQWLRMETFDDREKASLLPIGPCFMPLMQLHRSTPESLEDFAAKQLHFRRNHRTPFNRCYRLIPKDEEFKSSILNH